MHEIDFLPADYRKQHAKRKHRSWRLIVLVAIVVALGLAALVQSSISHRLAQDLATIAPAHELAVEQSEQLTDLQTRLKEAQADAELYTFLRHPWPRTQILAAVFGRLPEELTFDRIEVGPKRRAVATTEARPSRSEQKAKEARLAALPAASRTLKQLRDASNSVQTVVTLRGVTTESAALHRYLAALEKCPLFSSVELSDFESSLNDQADGTLQFSAELVVRPGYGEPHGPLGPNRELVAQAGGAP